MKHVAIVGAGGTGLCCAKHFLSSKHGVKLVPTVYEQRECLGGTWVYQDVSSYSENVFSSVYDNLRTNLPKQIMCFPDFPFPEEERSYLHHSAVASYLSRYAEKHKLRNCILFNHRVVEISPYFEKREHGFIQWKVQTEDLKKNSKTCKIFDAVVVCNGHYSVPNIPDIPGMENFRGEFLHSHYYRAPSKFKNQTVMLLGAGPSGVDIVLDLSAYCRKVYIAHRGKRIVAKLPENVVQLTNVVEISADGRFVLDNGDRHAADVFVACTGYKYDMPFLTPNCDVHIEGRYVEPLYKQLFHLEYPSISFPGLLWKVLPFSMIHFQSAYITSVLNGTVQLPEKSTMREELEEELRMRKTSGEHPKYIHRLGDAQFPYADELAALSGCKTIPEYFKTLYNHVSWYRRHNLIEYKDHEYMIVSETEFKRVA